MEQKEKKYGQKMINFSMENFKLFTELEKQTGLKRQIFIKQLLEHYENQFVEPCEEDKNQV